MQMFSSQAAFPRETDSRDEGAKIVPCRLYKKYQGAVAKNGVGRQRESILRGPAYVVLSEGS